MKVPILSGIYANEESDWRVSLPFNLVAVPVGTGINDGYLRPADGIDLLGTGPGIARGGINWRGVCYRVMGSKLVTVDAAGLVTPLGDVGNDGKPVRLDYSFDRLAIWNSGHLFYWNGSALTQVTDTDLGTVIDGCWLAGYFVSTDGQFIIVTDLNDPTSVNPLMYGSSESDPDPVMALARLRNELYAFNRNTIEVFQNVGGDNFPFQRIDGAQVPRGVIGTHAWCEYGPAFAMLGSGRNEAPAIWQVGGGQSVKLSTREVDQVLKTYSEAQLAAAVLERRVDSGLEQLWVRLADRTLVYDTNASAALSTSVWYEFGTALTRGAQHRAAFLVWCYDQWLVGDPASSNVGRLTYAHANHWAQVVGHLFDTTMLYNEGNNALLHELELVALPGRTTLGADPTIWTSHSFDGEEFGQERPISAGRLGERQKRLCWRTQGQLRNARTQRFRWTSDTLLSVTRLEMAIEPMAKRHG